MADINSKKKSFDERLEHLRREHSSEFADADNPPSMSSEDISTRLREWETLLDRRLEEYWSAKGQVPLPPLPEQLPFSAGREAVFREWAEYVDAIMLKEVGLDSYFPSHPQGFLVPLRFVGNEQSMQAWVTRACDLSTQTEIPHVPHVMHIPGQGTIINLGAYPQNETVPGSANTNLYTGFAADLAQERWGWGFLMEYTALGKDAGEEKLWTALSCERLGLPTQGGKARALQHIWRLSEAGWENWVREFVMTKARNAIGDKKNKKSVLRLSYEIIAGIGNVFPVLVQPFASTHSLLSTISLKTIIDLVSSLILEHTEIIPTKLNSLIVNAQELCGNCDEAVKSKSGTTLTQWLGLLAFSKLETHIGIQSTPYAVMIAFHNECHILKNAKDGPAVLAVAKKNPRANPDTRLALLSELNSNVKYNPQTMSNAAWELLRLNGPGSPCVPELPHSGES